MVSNIFISTHILHYFPNRDINNRLCSITPIKILTANEFICKNTEPCWEDSSRAAGPGRAKANLPLSSSSGLSLKVTVKTNTGFALKEFQRRPPWQEWIQWRWIQKMRQFPAGRCTAFWTTVSIVCELMFGEGQVKGYRMTCQLAAPGASSPAIRDPTTCKFIRIESPCCLISHQRGFSCSFRTM